MIRTALLSVHVSPVCERVGKIEEKPSEVDNNYVYTSTWCCSLQVWIHVIWTANNQGSDFALPAGRYEYPFQYMLKQDLPCSFESINGHVRYVVIVIIDRPWKFDHVCREAFTVLTTLDLNNEDISLKVRFDVSLNLIKWEVKKNRCRNIFVCCFGDICKGEG